MSPQDFLGKLPTLDELLEHPRVRDAASRWNRSAAAARVRTALTSFTAEATRRAESLSGLSPADLLDRFVQRLETPAAPPSRGAINATGALTDRQWAGPPLPAAAVEAFCSQAGSYRVMGTASPSAEALNRLVHSEAAAVYASHAAATGLALKALAGGAAVVVARSEVGELAGGLKLTEVAESAGVRLHDVGDAQGASPEEYAAGVESLRADGVQRPVIYRSDAGGAPDRPTTEAIAEVAHRSGGLLIEDLSASRPRDDTPAYGAERPSVAASLAGGADLVVLHGGGRIGGPGCGVLAGKRAVVEEIDHRLDARSQRADPLVDAALAATLDLFAEPEQLRFSHPQYELLDAPLENLQTRAERLAPQMAAAEGIADAEAVASAASGAATPSWAVALTPADGDADRLVERLAGASPGVVARVEAGRVLLDLRTVFPRQDAALLGAVGLGEVNYNGTD